MSIGFAKKIEFIIIILRGIYHGELLDIILSRIYSQSSVMRRLFSLIISLFITASGYDYRCSFDSGKIELASVIGEFGVERVIQLVEFLVEL